MAWGTPMGTHKRVSGNTGKNATFKKSDYAKGPVPESMQGTKPGKTEHAPYSGPDVAVPPRA